MLNNGYRWLVESAGLLEIARKRLPIPSRVA